MYNLSTYYCDFKFECNFVYQQKLGRICFIKCSKKRKKLHVFLFATYTGIFIQLQNLHVEVRKILIVRVVKLGKKCSGLSEC